MDYSSTVEQIRPSIAKIYSFGSDNSISGTGSGFLFAKPGIMVTCDHVVEESKSLLCRFPDSDDFYPAKIVMRDSEHDLALLKLEKAVVYKLYSLSPVFLMRSTSELVSPPMRTKRIHDLIAWLYLEQIVRPHDSAHVYLKPDLIVLVRDCYARHRLFHQI
jgi:hypothetical protein